MKALKLSIIGCIAGITGFAQSNMMTHIIKPKESISSIARLYHVSKDEIFKLNNLNEKTILRIGQKIVISVNNKTVAVQSKPTDDKPSVVANGDGKKHLVVSGDNLSRIAKQYHVTEKQIKEWNNLKNDIIRAGSYLIVSEEAYAPSKTVKVEPKTVVEEVKPTKTEAPDKKVETPIAATPVQPTKVVIEEKSTKNETVSTTPKITISQKGGSFFEKQYTATQNSVEGLSGTFKTIAGWQDQKFYVLLNGAQSGTVVKVSANNKTIYAKVLGPLPNIKEDSNLALRVSNAAAAALGIVESKFNAKVDF